MGPSALATVLTDHLENIKSLSIAKMKSAIAILIAVLAISATAKVLSTDLGEDASSSTPVPDESSTPPPEPETTPAGSQSISVTTSLVLSSVVLMKLCQ